MNYELLNFSPIASNSKLNTQTPKLAQGFARA
jgi:hypothetical protein